jgi:hypothetical protein
VDVSVGRDGALLFLVSPVFQGERFEEYTGCYVQEVEGLNPPRLRRDLDGMPVVRAMVDSSDSALSGAIRRYD